MVEDASTHLERLTAAARERRLSPATQAAYRLAWSRFLAWCAVYGLDPAALPREKARGLRGTDPQPLGLAPSAGEG